MSLTFLPRSLPRACMLALSVLLLSTLSGPLLAAPCAAGLKLHQGAGDWNGWGNGGANWREANAGIASGDLDKLTLRWAFGFPGAGSSIGNPVVVGNAVFTGSETGDVYALDADTGCVFWTFHAEKGVRTSPSAARVGQRWLLFFGDRGATVYALDGETGELVWQRRVDTHPAAILTGAPQFVHLADASPADRLFVPVSSSEEGMAAAPGYPCCSFQGSVVSLDAATGAQLWKQHTILNAVHATGDNRYGPSGASVWSAPTIDLEDRRLFVTTGDAYSAPADIATDAVIGMDLLTGKTLWINPGTTDDVWTVKCLSGSAPDDCGPDQDYGSPAMLVGNDGGPFLLAGQKSGIVRAFTLDGGTEVWNTALVDNPDAFGGKIVWGGATDGLHAFFGLGTGGIVGINIRNGGMLWTTELPPVAGREAHPGQDGPLAVSEDLVISGGWDGMLRILAANSGKVLWQFDTAREYTAVNGVPTKGGSMGAAGPVVADKRLFVPSGYVGVKNGMGGNALLMFSAKTPQ